MSEGQQLNSLDRFRKRPGRLVLEEHSHCEVPAGCGGVVLRWRNPWAALPLTIYLYAPVPAVCLIDGAEQRSGRIDLPPGPHVVATALENIDLSAGLLLFAAVHDPARRRAASPTDVVERLVRVLTADDGTWKFTLLPPATREWAAVGFDDRDWNALTRAPTPQLGARDFGAYQCRHCGELGAICVRLPTPAAGEERVSWWRRLLGVGPEEPSPPGRRTVWIRKRFELPAPERPGPQA
jgi:hypothetical protein